MRGEREGDDVTMAPAELELGTLQLHGQHHNNNNSHASGSVRHQHANMLTMLS